MLIYDSKANRIKIKFKKISNLIPDSCFVKQCLLPLRYWYYANSISVNTLILLACYKSDGKQNNEIKAQATRTVIIIFCVLFIAHFPLGTVAFQENILELATFRFALKQLLLVSKK